MTPSPTDPPQSEEYPHDGYPSDGPRAREPHEQCRFDTVEADAENVVERHFDEGSNSDLSASLEDVGRVPEGSAPEDLIPEGPPRRRERSGTLEALALVVVAFLLAFTVKTYVAEAYEIKGRSMEPTFGNGQRVVVLKAFYGLERGDIIVFSAIDKPQKDLIKRVVGLPGETIRIQRGKVYVDGELLNESYVEYGDAVGSSRSFRVPEDSYYVLGDNRPDSHDSRYFNAVPGHLVKGKVFVRWWPFGEFSSF